MIKSILKIMSHGFYIRFDHISTKGFQLNMFFVEVIIQSSLGKYLSGIPCNFCNIKCHLGLANKIMK